MAFRRFLRHRLAVLGTIIVVVMIASAILAPVLAPRDPLRIYIKDKFSPPGTNGLVLGADELGRDLLSRLLYAGRISLTAGFVAMLITVSIGSLVGLVAGYYEGLIDVVLMRLTDALLSFPQLFLLVGIAAFIKPSLKSITIIIGLTSWMQVARIIRNQTQSLKNQDFVLASRSIGATNRYIISRHLLINVLAPILVAATLNVANAILAESYISYLGYGIQPPRASWGNMLNNAQSYFASAPWLAIFPGVAITLAVVGFNFVGDGLRDAFDPRTHID